MLFGPTGQLIRLPQVCLTHKLVYGKACHFSIELEHKAMWAMKKLKMDWSEAAEQQLNGLNELDEFLLKTYESSAYIKKR